MSEFPALSGGWGVGGCVVVIMLEAQNKKIEYITNTLLKIKIKLF